MGASILARALREGARSSRRPQAAMDRYGNPVHEKAAQEAFLPLASKLLLLDFVAE